MQRWGYFYVPIRYPANVIHLAQSLCDESHLLHSLDVHRVLRVHFRRPETHLDGKLVQRK
jgi:hypothetical protein